MRLLNSETLEMKEFYGEIPPYAILSHTWGDEEVTFQDFHSPDREKKKGFDKILGCCQQAQRDRIDWTWIDTCCIDKTSSAELSEAINSMYAWYRDSEVCYVFLEDVSFSFDQPEQDRQKFAAARWFKRGWCLQELIAPLRTEFYAQDWCEIGTKRNMGSQIENITGIPADVLQASDRNLHRHTIAEKMSWASERTTTRIEDGAYCLLGIFGVHMPLLYGEGGTAFRRLQEEIIKQTEDYSFLLWSIKGTWLFRKDESVLAPSPCFFFSEGMELQEVQRDGSAGPSIPATFRDIVVPTQAEQLGSMSQWWVPPRMTSRGLNVCMPLSPISADIQAWVAYANERPLWFLWTRCLFKGRLVGILLGADETPGGFKRYRRSRYGLSRLFLMPNLEVSPGSNPMTANIKGSLWNKWQPLRSEIYLQAAHDGPSGQRSRLDANSRSNLDVIISPTAQSRMWTISGGNHVYDLCFTTETITKGPRKGEKRLHVTGLRLVQGGAICLGSGEPKFNLFCVERLEMSFTGITDNSPTRTPVTLHVRLRAGDVESPKCKLCLAVSPQQTFYGWNLASDRDALCLPNGMVLTAAIKVHTRAGPEIANTSVGTASTLSSYPRSSSTWFSIHIDLRVPPSAPEGMKQISS
ncbi:heterokaryon incompatibility protein-domain-containing protein [Cladorrhinum sp. PSN332]|nr:heterokaryon incompatibility protein-domain-containing protein [Cladorrhinum sp. PSN332]